MEQLAAVFPFGTSIVESIVSSQAASAAVNGRSQTLFNLFFAALLLVTAGYFVSWGLDYTGHQQVVLFLLASFFGLFMAFNIGGNDVANSFGTSVGAGTLTVTQALLIAAIFEISGAVLAGGEVTRTIRQGIVDLSHTAVSPQDFMFIMMAALLAAALWLLFATFRGYPVSTTHSIVGGIVGSSLMLGVVSSDAGSALGLVQWNKIGSIALSWVLSPLLGGLMSYLVYAAIRRHILRYNERAEAQIREIRQQKIAHREQHRSAFDRLSELQRVAYTAALARDAALVHGPDIDADDLESDYYRELRRIEQQRNELYAHRALEQGVPLFAALGAAVISSMLLFKGLKNLELGLSTLHNFLIIGMIGASCWMITFIYARSLRGESLQRSTFLMFSWMQVFTAAGFAFSHGSNDIANAIGPFAGILDVLRSGEVAAQAAVPPVAMISFGVAMVVGLWFIGKEVIQTVGHKLTEMHPASGFAAELSSAAVVMIASLMGLPVSSTHILIGAVLGVGLVNRQGNWALMKPIALAWIITVPAAAAMSAVSFLALRSMF